jgi:hypothetical protein
MTRRALVHALASVVALLLGLPAFRSFGPAPERLEQRLRRMLRAPESAAVIGRAYLASHPEERSSAALGRGLRAALPDELDDAALRVALRARIREEFRREEVVQVEGWILARTEARVAALAAL